MMASDGWAVTLLLGDDERLEARVARIVDALARLVPDGGWLIEELEANGPVGGTLGWNPRQPFELDATELQRVLEEDGWVIELDATLRHGDAWLVKVQVRDGIYVDVQARIPRLGDDVLGPHENSP